MVVRVNGEPREIAATTVADLLAELDHEGGFVAVALNTHVVRRAAWGETPIKEGDAVEIVTPRQGG